MRILCMRHGHADPGHGLKDEERFLSATGRLQVRAVAQALRDAGIELDAVVTSPLVRAVQTAEIAALALAFEGEVRTLPSLSFEASPHRAAKELQSLASTVLAVGHMPTLPATLHALIGGRGPASLDTAQVVCVEDGRAAWTITSRDLSPRSLS